MDFFTVHRSFLLAYFLRQLTSSWSANLCVLLTNCLQFLHMPHTHFLKIYLTHEECDLIFAALCIGCFVSSIKDIEVSVIIILDLHNYDIAALTQLTVISYPVLFDFQDQILGYQYQLYQHIREERWLSFTYFGHHYDHHVVFLIGPYEHY